MSDVPPPTNAFEKMMAAARGATATPAVVADEEDVNEPVYTAVLYEAWLEHADPEEPLWRVPYFGQVVRVGTAEAVFKIRKRQHEADAAREDKDLGFHAVIDMFGAEAIAWRIVSSETGPRIAMRELANAEETRLIDEHGGMLQDMDAKRTQTLNLTKGGQGNPRVVWEAIDARRRRALTKFQTAMKKYCEEHDSALVPTMYVDDDGYRLGNQLSNFRQGKMRKGLPEEAKINAWAEALPGWHWNAHQSDDWYEGRVQCAQEQSRKAFDKFKTAMAKYVTKYESALVPAAYVDDDGYPLGASLSHFRHGNYWKNMPWEDEAKVWAEELPEWHWDARKSDAWRDGCAQRGHDQWANASEETRAAWSKAQSDAQNRPEVRAASVQRGKDQAANRTAEQEVDRLAKLKKTMATDASKTKRSNISTAQWKNASEETRAAWSKSISDARNRPEVRAKNVQSGKDQAANETAEKKVYRLAKLKTTMATDASKAKRRKISTDQLARERHAELVRARSIAVPFEKSKKRRAELRAASTDLSGKKGNAVLYMVSEDGATIRRVTKDGMMQMRTIVGPVVDPPSAEAGPSDLNAYVSDSESD